MQQFSFEEQSITKMPMSRFSAFRLLLFAGVALCSSQQLSTDTTTTTSASTAHEISAENQVEIRDEPKSCSSTDITTGSVTTDDVSECVVSNNNNSTNKVNDVENSDLNNRSQFQCGLYLAESTIPGAGLGAFTGIDRKPGDIIGQGEVMVPIYDAQYHLQALGPKIAKRDDWEYLDPTRDYVWYGSDLGMQYESSNPFDHISGIAYGLDAAINCHLALFNADKEYASYDFANLHRSIDPGIGAFTPYHNASTSATRNLVAGSELFKSYGDQWFVDRTETFGLLPLTNDYNVVEAMLKKLQQILEYGKIPIDVRLDLYERFILANPFRKTSRTLLTVPKVYADFQYIAQYGIQKYYQKSAIRSVHYLEQHGRCVDTIEPKRSTLRQAGRGAFATRSFKKETIVIGTPFFYYANDDFFKLYKGNWITKDKNDFHPDQHIGYQLMYNYCWRHENYKIVSSIVLCPYGMNVNYINHNQSLANVRVQWAKDGEMNHNASLLRSHPREMYYSDAPKLWLDFVATRDIAKGEEIFMDYGNIWEEAWRKHAAKWNKDNYYPTDYISAYDWNKMNAKAMLRTRDEQEEEPYPNHFAMVCLPEIDDPKYTELLTSSVCERTWIPSTLGLQCYILDREQQSDGSYWYQVKYKSHAENAVWTVSDWIVREAIKFVNKPYTNDIFLEDAFRQPIGIPNDVFPDAWRGIHLPPLPKEERKSRSRKNEKKPWLTSIMSLFL
jgi:SET domain